MSTMNLSFSKNIKQPRLRVVVQVRGVAVRRTPASALSPPLSFSLLSPSLPPLPPRLSLPSSCLSLFLSLSLSLSPAKNVQDYPGHFASLVVIITH